MKNKHVKKAIDSISTGDVRGLRKNVHEALVTKVRASLDKREKQIAKSFIVSINEGAYDSGGLVEASRMTNKEKFSTLKKIKNVEVRKLGGVEGMTTLHLVLRGKALATMDSPNAGIDKKEYIQIHPDGEALLKKEGILSESMSADVVKKKMAELKTLHASLDDLFFSGNKAAYGKALKKAVALGDELVAAGINPNTGGKKF